jgi:formylmethanofuran dehydrogenase subunit D
MIGVALFILTALPVRLAAQQDPAAGLSSLPLEAQPSVSAALGRDLPEYHVQARSGGFKAQNPQHKLAAAFSSEGVAVRGENISWRIVLSGYGYGVVLTSSQPAAPRAKLNRVEYRRGSLTEWYVNGPAGLEQGFTITKSPGQANHQPLTIALALSRELTAAVDDDRTGLSLKAPDGKAAFRYTGLSAADAAGKKLPAWLEVQGGQLLLRVRDAGARYPVVIDPWVQLAELTASDGTSGDTFGASVSISGNTVVVGSPNSNDRRGAAYVFVRPARGWSNMTQTAKLTASEGAYAKLGSAVSISGDTIVVGAPSQPVFNRFNSNNFRGTAYVFVKPASGWADMKPTAKLTASDGAPGDFMGLSVGISGDTIVVGATQADSEGRGAAYVFVKPRGGWADMTETAELTASDGTWGSFFGFSVSISRKTVVVGANNALVDGRYQGAAYVFEKPKKGWANMTQTAKLTASNASVTSNFGFSVSISEDTAVIGDPDEAVEGIQNQGAAYVFVKPASGWMDMTETAELTVPYGQAVVSVISRTRQSHKPTPDNLGWSVFISSNSVVAGAPGHNYGTGAAYVFQEPDGGWKTSSKFNAALTAKAGKKGGAFGQSVSIKGHTVLVGADLATVGSNSEQGAAYLFDSETAAWPTLSSGR